MSQPGCLYLAEGAGGPGLLFAYFDAPLFVLWHNLGSPGSLGRKTDTQAAPVSLFMPSGSVRDRSSGGVLDFSGGMEAGNRYIKQNFVLTRRENHHILISVIILVILAEK